MNSDMSFQIGQPTQYQQGYDQNNYSQDVSNGQNKTMWNWFNSKLVNTFVEKAKVFLFKNVLIKYKLSIFGEAGIVVFLICLVY